MAVTTSMLLDASTLNGPIAQKKFKYATGSQSTHEVRWDNAVAKVYEASNISTPEIIEAKNMDKHVHIMLSVGMKRVFTSEPPPLRIKHPHLALKYQDQATPLSSEQKILTEALNHLHACAPPATTTINCGTKLDASPFLISKWAGYPWNSKGQIPRFCLTKLHHLYHQVK